MLNGIDLEGLCAQVDHIEFPDPVKGRVAHIDADFLAYQVSYESGNGEPKSLGDMKHNAEMAVHTLGKLAGATEFHLHLTPATSNKGGRFDQAIQKQYQGNRQDKPKPRYLHIIRDWMGGHFPATLHQECEADDGMSSAQYSSIAKGDRNLSIIVSKDKDLGMVPGLHMDWDTGRIEDSETDYGRIYAVHPKGDGTLKVKGIGHKFFWAQMLMGDGADNIQGLPKLPGFILNEIKPTKETNLAHAILHSPNSNERQKQMAKKTLSSRKPASCGPVLAMACLNTINSNREAFAFVKSLYQTLAEIYTFTHWKTGEEVHWGKVFISEAQMLWMRRNKNDPMDVVKWLQEIAT